MQSLLYVTQPGYTDLDVDCIAALGPTRFVVAHYHIFKNGGTTIESILEREFSGAFANFHGASDAAVLDPQALAQFIHQNPGLRALTSHHIRYPKAALRNTVLFDCCFLRHPLDRLQSVYTYHRMINSEDPLSRLAREGGARAFIQTLVDESPHFVSNAQVVHLACGGAFTRPAGRHDLDAAAAILREMAIPGLVEMFDESLTAAEYFLRPAFPNLNLSYTPKNVSRPLGTPSGENQLNLKATWGSELYETVERLNEFDLALFELARREVLRRFNLIPNRSQRLAEFKVRCAALASPAPADPDRHRQHVA